MPAGQFTLEQDIDVFCICIKNQIETIRNLQNSDRLNSNLYSIKATLYSSLLDTMAKYLFHNVTGNRDRFVNFVNDFCEWDDCNRISLPQLYYFLKYFNDPRFTELMIHVEKIKQLWMPASCILINQDPMKNELEEFWPKDEIKCKVEGKNRIIHLENFDHKHMLWYQRNVLIHEGRKSGYSIELFDSEKPHYVELIGNPPTTSRYNEVGKSSFQLYYPIEFYEALVIQGLRNFKKTLKEKMIDPHLYINSSYLWMDVDFS